MIVGMRRLFIVALTLTAVAFLLTRSGLAQSDTPSASTFIYGGSDEDLVTAVAVDTAGNTYITGRTRSKDLPQISNAYQKVVRGTGLLGTPGVDAFVAKLNDDGRVLWSSYLGGNDARQNTRSGGPVDEARAIAVDLQGNVYVAGLTSSTDFPTVNAFQPMPQAPNVRTAYGNIGATDGFLTKFNPDGSQLLFSTYLGAVDESARTEAVAIGANGDVWVLVRSMAAQFPRTHDFSNGSGSVFLGRFTSSGTSISWTRLGFGEDDVGGLAIDRAGQPHVLMQSFRATCPRGATATSCPGVVLTQFDQSATRVRFSWSLPLTGLLLYQQSTDLAVGEDGTIVISGRTRGPLPIVNAFQTDLRGASDAFIAILNPRGVPEMISYVGGSGEEQSGRPQVALDADGQVHLAFGSESVDLPTLRAIIPRPPGGPVFASADRGQSWTWAAQGLSTGVTQFAFDVGRNIVYAAGGGVLSRTINHGESWQRVRHIDPIPIGGRVAIDLRDTTTIYAGSRDLYRLDRDGQNATLLRQAGSGVGGYRVDSLAVSPHDGSVWVGNGSGLEVSFDRGATWTRRDNELPAFSVGPFNLHATPYVMAFDPRRAGTVFVGVDNGIYTTQDAGVRWQELTATLLSGGRPERPMVRSLVLDPSNPDRIYAATFNRGMVITDDGGQTWRRTLSSMAINAIAVDHAPPYQVYASVSEYSTGRSAVMVSRDRGETWASTPLRGFPVLATHPGDAARLYAASSGTPSSGYLSRYGRVGDSYAQSFASYLMESGASDVGLTRDRATVLVSNGAVNGGDIAIVRITR